MIAFVLIFGPIFAWLCLLGFAVCKAARHGDEQLECDPPEPESDWAWPPFIPDGHEMRRHSAMRAFAHTRRGDVV